MAASPSPELVNLERQVSLELAHIRDSGPTDPAQRKQLFEASQLEQKGEAAIKSGDYKSAEDSLLRAASDSAPILRMTRRRRRILRPRRFW